MRLLSLLTEPRHRFNLEITLRAAASVRRRSFVRKPAGPMDIFLAVVDHYEPQHGHAPTALARERHEDWLLRYPKIAAAHRDADGRPPAHGFFYPWDEFDEWEFRLMVEVCAEGWGEIELHLHHHHDTEATLRRKIRDAVQTYADLGALTRWPDGRPAFSFIHGNWALDNSRFDENWCGVNNEIDLLLEEGCYADFTFPSWKQTSQPRQLNSIYYAVDDPQQPKSYDTGEPARAGKPDRPGLLMVQGPLVPFIKRGGKRIGFGMDDGDLAHSHRYYPARLDRWVRAGVQVEGRPDRIFIKLFCHGAPEANRHALLGGDLDALFSDAEARYNDGEWYRLHYVTAREMFNVIRATVANAPGDPHVLRDYLLPRPAAATRPTP